MHSLDIHPIHSLQTDCHIKQNCTRALTHCHVNSSDGARRPVAWCIQYEARSFFATCVSSASPSPSSPPSTTTTPCLHSCAEATPVPEPPRPHRRRRRSALTTSVSSMIDRTHCGTPFKIPPCTKYVDDDAGSSLTKRANRQSSTVALVHGSIREKSATAKIPRDHESASNPLYRAFDRISGQQYASEPFTPRSVRESYSVGLRSRESPKSMSLTRPNESITMFSVLMSRCTTCRACINSMAFDT